MSLVRTFPFATTCHRRPYTHIQRVIRTKRRGPLRAAGYGDQAAKPDTIEAEALMLVPIEGAFDHD